MPNILANTISGAIQHVQADKATNTALIEENNDFILVVKKLN